MSFAEAAKQFNLKDGDGVFRNAQQLWSMLDEMAASNPAAYKAFIEKQRQEHEALVKQNAPPTPVFAVATADVCRACMDQDRDVIAQFPSASVNSFRELAEP